ncbi:unnamed protein product [Meganyctiphanes norvegica]|uniref:Uncharacterized protein n=1 Tax=Meganyctiphanes norvegica TaxID=48144 RepID=A0AAV2QNZ1_MEGNR
MRSYPSKSPAATCSLDTGFQIEWHPSAVTEEEVEGEGGDDSGSACSSCSCLDSNCGTSRHGSTLSLAPHVSYHPTGPEEQNILLACGDRDRVVRSPTPAQTNCNPTLYPNRVATVQGLPELYHCCHVCTRIKGLMGHFGLKLCEVIPWIIGFTLIIYFYRVLGIGPGMGILLIMVVFHGLLRFLKAHGDLNCYKYKVKKTHATLFCASQLPNITPDNGDQSDRPDGVEPESELEQNSESITEVACHLLELPPSYEAAVTKPPPYDLNLHLTPNDASYLKVHYVTNVEEPSQNNNISYNHLSSQVVPTTHSNTNYDSFLPSYDDVIKNSKGDNSCNSERTQQILVTEL